MNVPLPTWPVDVSASSDLPDGQPLSVSRQCALIVWARGIRRERVEHLVVTSDLPEGFAAGALRPAVLGEPAVQRVLLGSEVHPDGIDRTRVQVATDTPVSLCELYVPTLSLFAPYESWIESISNYRVDPPDCYRCEQYLAGVNDPYRQSHQPSRSFDFHGYPFGDTIDKARRGIFQLGGGAEPELLVLVAYAWPFLWLHFAHDEVFIAYDRSGSLVTARFSI